jgi:mitochondrial inner membrane protein COX18
MTQLHSITGTPWYFTIPLAALLVNLTFRLPPAIHSRLIQQRQARLSPVLQAWLARIQLDNAKRPISREKARKETASRYRRVQSRIFRELGVQSWKLYSPILVFPVWLSVIEAVKRLSGETRGLFSSLVFGARMKDAAAAAAAGNPAANDGSLSVTSDVASVAETTGANIHQLPALSSGVDPSMAIEGCLWFSDLTAPDPLHVLPVLLSVSLVANLIPATAEGRRQLLGLRMDETMPKSRIRLQRMLLPIAALIGPWTMGLPSALHLYWLSSSLTTLIMTRTLKVLMPVDRREIKPCQGRDTPVIQAQYLEKLTQ